MKKISIVILNYLNYWDTIECIESIYEMQYDIVGIIVVDNHSENESMQILRNRYKNHKDIILVRTGKNYGFAKGNNIGIKIAKEFLESNYIFIVNNDTVFCQKDFFDVLLSYYKKGIGVIGPQIILKDENIQSRYSTFTSLKNNIKIYLRDCMVYGRKGNWAERFLKINLAERTIALHGCALLFTPDFFEHYQGFYDKTFLYREEDILYCMCQRCGLQQVYAWDSYLYHKEDQSSGQSFQNSEDVKRKFYIKSQKYLIWWIIRNKCRRGLLGYDHNK